MNNDTAARIVNTYFKAEETEALPQLLALFTPDATVRNAANPADEEPGAVERFAMSFWERTEKRSFSVIDIAHTDNEIYALFNATMHFREGAMFGPVVAKKAFSITVPAALRMKVDIDGLVTELDIHHETTTAPRLAATTP